MTLCSKQNNRCALNEFLSMRIADTGLSWAYISESRAFRHYETNQFEFLVLFKLLSGFLNYVLCKLYRYQCYNHVCSVNATSLKRRFQPYNILNKIELCGKRNNLCC